MRREVGWVLSILIWPYWPTVWAQDELYRNASAPVEDRVEDLLARMTLQEKISQMIMEVENSPELPPSIGAFIIGASDPPAGNTPAAWRSRLNALQNISANQRLGIPLLFATDAVHGQNVIAGATIFPHNIGLGATRNPKLVQQIAQAAAEECMTSGLDMTFAPMLAVARHITWGRTYESYSQDTDTVRLFAKSFIQGLQGKSTPWKIVGTAKHWVGDGGTTDGKDAGDTDLSEQELLQIHGAPYIDAIAADVGVIMASFSSVNGVMMHQNEHLILEVLKGTLGFDGFVLSDWEGYQRNGGSNYDEQISLAVNAGIDMLMSPYQGYAAIASMTNSLNSGTITQDRIDEAARRILRVKFKAGLFEKKASPLSLTDFNPLGTAAHRNVARQAVRESLVLLKNDNGLLPLAKSARLFVAGSSADNIRNQCGGWTMSWQGTLTDDSHQIVGGTTILEGLRQAGNVTTYSMNGKGASLSKHDAAIIVVGETPYAEFYGDATDLRLNATDIETIATVKESGLPIVLVIVSGRPMIITSLINDIDAVVAAWLPGTEGDGIAQVLLGDYDFVGTLSFSWPANMNQVLSGFVGDNPDVLFPFGYGLNYTATAVDESSNGTDASLPPQGNSSDVSLSPDTQAPTQPGDPQVTNVTYSSITITWTAADDNVGVYLYRVYDGPYLAGSTKSTSFQATGLSQDSLHSYSVVAVDRAGNESPSSGSVSVATLFLVDDFDDGDLTAENGWGTWRAAYGGTNSDGQATLKNGGAGFEGYGLQLSYSVDTGKWGFCNLFLDFDSGMGIDLNAKSIIGVQFDLRGKQGISLSVQVGTPLATYNSVYYKYELAPTVDWMTVMVDFADFTTNGGNPYSILEALQNASAIVWETDNVGSSGWFELDNVAFVTPNSMTSAERIGSVDAIHSSAWKKYAYRWTFSFSMTIAYFCLLL